VRPVLRPISEGWKEFVKIIGRAAAGSSWLKHVNTKASVKSPAETENFLKLRCWDQQRSRSWQIGLRRFAKPLDDVRSIAELVRL